MEGALISLFCGAGGFLVAALIRARASRLMAGSVPADLRAIGHKEQLGGEGDIYYHVVYEVTDGPLAGLQAASALGHGRPSRLPEGIIRAHVNAEDRTVMTRSARRVNMVLQIVFAGAGLIAWMVAFAFIAAPAPSPDL